MHATKLNNSDSRLASNVFANFKFGATLSSASRSEFQQFTFHVNDCLALAPANQRFSSVELAVSSSYSSARN